MHNIIRNLFCVTIGQDIDKNSVFVQRSLLCWSYSLTVHNLHQNFDLICIFIIDIIQLMFEK